MQVALTSNVQIYNRDNNEVNTNGNISTSQDLPIFTYPTYPYISNNDELYPLFQLNYYNINTLISQEITSIIVVERLSYNPINFYHSSYEYTGSAYVLLGPALSNEDTSYLTSNYDIAIKSKN